MLDCDVYILRRFSEPPLYSNIVYSISKCVVTGGTVQVSGLICVEGCEVHEQYILSL